MSADPAGLDPTAPLILLWDADKLERDEWDLLGVEVLSLAALTDRHLAQLDALDLPRVECADASLADTTVANLLRWARQRHGEGAQAKGDAAA